MTSAPVPHAIEVESYRILRQRVDLSRFSPGPAAVVARVIHASADLEYAATMVVDEAAVDAGVAALRAGAPVVVDVEMVRHGISGHRVRATQAGHGVRATQAGHDVRATQAGHGVRATQAGPTLEAGSPLVECFLGRAEPDDEAPTRSAAGVRAAAHRHPRGAVVVIGCAPTALAEVVRLHAGGQFRPALVIGLPVGFVGAAAAKEALRHSGLPAISNVGEKGGSAVAAAAFNALARLAAVPSG